MSFGVSENSNYWAILVGILLALWNPKRGKHETKCRYFPNLAVS